MNVRVYSIVWSMKEPTPTNQSVIQGGKLHKNIHIHQYYIYIRIYYSPELHIHKNILYIFTSIAFFGQVICILYHVQYSVDYLARVCDLSPWCYLCSCVAACALTNWTKYEDKNITIEKKKQLKKSDNGLKAKEEANYSKRTRSTQMIIKRWFKCFQNSNLQYVRT